MIGPVVTAACIVPSTTPDVLMAPTIGAKSQVICIEGMIIPSMSGVRFMFIILDHRLHGAYTYTYDGIGIENVSVGTFILSPTTTVVLSITIGELLPVPPIGSTAVTLPDVSEE
jgi:hypothetical protein